MVDKIISAANADGAVAYRQGLYDSIKLTSEVNWISKVAVYWICRNMIMKKKYNRLLYLKLPEGTHYEVVRYGRRNKKDNEKWEFSK